MNFRTAKAPVKKVIVVDASVAQAAKVYRAHEKGVACARVLQTIRMVCHRAAFGSVLEREYSLHESPWASDWRTSMAQKGKWVGVAEENRRLTGLLASTRCPLTKSGAAAALKDLHLVVLALASDRIILSTDDTAGDLFARLAKLDDRLAPVHWINPRTHCDGLIPWLEQGAPERADWQLGSRSSR